MFVHGLLSFSSSGDQKLLVGDFPAEGSALIYFVPKLKVTAVLTTVDFAMTELLQTQEDA